MNILFTNYCNQKCSYCFAAYKLKLSQPTVKSYISTKNLRKIINFCKKSNVNHVGILGGEPTLHPDFSKAIKMIASEGLRFTIFSNGIIRNKKDILFLRDIEDKKCNIIININAPDSYKGGGYARVKETLQMLHKKISLGFNIYQEELETYFLIELVKKYNLKREIRLGIASPILGYDNQYVPLDKHRIIAKKIVEFAGRCDEADIACYFDCGFTLCSFTRSECGKLHYFNAHLVTHCKPVIDVAPDLTVWQCFVTSTLWNRKLTDFKDMDEILRFYENKFKGFRKVGATEKCLSCKYLLRKQCSGGCLAHTLRSFNVERKIGKGVFL
ncbi:MAG: radical SAM protein [Candidatus Omnitrophota bacterium]